MQLLTKKILLSGLWLLSCVFVVNSMAQGPYSFLGARENLGLYGGYASDYAYEYNTGKLFATVNGPATFFISEDTCNSWVLPFPLDSIENTFGTRGWGRGSEKVLTNLKGWVAVKTGRINAAFDAMVVSYDKGESFQTAMDKHLYQSLGIPYGYEGIYSFALTDHFLFTGVGKLLFRINDTTSFDPNMVIAKMDTIPGGNSSSKILSVAASNSITGLPLYVVVDHTGSGSGILYKYDGLFFTQVFSLPTNYDVLSIHTHPAHAGGDTVLVSYFDNFTMNLGLDRSFDGGDNWDPVTPSFGMDKPLSDVDFSPDWISYFPASYGVRISFPNGVYSNNLGGNWQVASVESTLATHPNNIDVVVGAFHSGPSRSVNGPQGLFELRDNLDFMNTGINMISNEKDIVYMASDAGLAYTSGYYAGIGGPDLWEPPYGLFPIPGVGGTGGVSAVAINPNDSLHVIAGHENGFSVSFNGPTAFFDVMPLDWNSLPNYDPMVTDILFVNSDTIVAVTGHKFKMEDNIGADDYGNIWLTEDGGLNWTLVTPYSPDPFYEGNCLAVGASGMSTVLYAGSGSMGVGSGYVPGALWKSFDFGFTWVKENDGPVVGPSDPMPIWDIDVDPLNNDIIHMAANLAFVSSFNGGASYNEASVMEDGEFFTAALVHPSFPDTVFAAGLNKLYEYHYPSDEYVRIFRGLPGEVFPQLSYGSLLAGSKAGGFSIKAASKYYISLKAFMEGPFNGAEMENDLNDQGLIPLNQPYNTSPWSYPGTESVGSIPDTNIVDWVLVELRATTGDSSTATSDKVIETKAAFILKDGTVKDVDGTTEPRFYRLFTDGETEKIYAIIYYRNHLGIMSADSCNLNSDTFSYDFTTGESQVYGGVIGHKEIAAGIWGMISGDANADGQVDNTDKNVEWASQAGTTGYLSADFDLNGQVDNSDKNVVWLPNSGSGSAVLSPQSSTTWHTQVIK